MINNLFLKQKLTSVNVLNFNCEIQYSILHDILK